MKIREIAELVNGEAVGDGDIEITSVADISAAMAGQIAFWTNSGDVPASDASCILTRSDSAAANDTARIVVNDPKLAFAIVAAKLARADERSGTSETASIHPSARIAASFIGAFACIGENSEIGEGTQIHDGANIGRNVSIGKDSVIHPNVTIYDNSVIGNNCVLHSGAVIGADGFGFVRDDSGVYHKFPQIGTVVIEDDVEIGANTCIDRGALGKTRIGKGTKIDNLVQVGHNSNIGQNCVIAAQTGISGSVTIEDGCVIGGQVGFGDHVTVKSGAVIGSQAGVLPGKIVRPGVWWGTPVQPLETFKRRNALLNRIEKLVEDIAELKRKLK